MVVLNTPIWRVPVSKVEAIEVTKVGWVVIDDATVSNVVRNR